MAMTGLTKSSATTMTNTAKNTVVMSGMVKAGQGWHYDEPGYTYDMATDPDGREVFYNSVGQETVMTPLTKNLA